MSIVQSQNLTTLYFALKKSSRGKGTRKLNGSMTISKRPGSRKEFRLVCLTILLFITIEQTIITLFVQNLVDEIRDLKTSPSVPKLGESDRRISLI